MGSLSTQIPDDVAIEAIVKAMQRDKKAVLGQITCVLAHAWGDVQIHKAMDPDLIAEVLQQKREAGKQEEVEV